MDDFSMISDHSMLFQVHSMFSAEECLVTRSSSGVLSTGGKTVPAPLQDKGDDMFFSDWPELVGFDDLEESLRNFEPTFEIGSNYFEDILWSSHCSPEAQLVRNGYSDDIDFSIDRNDSNTMKVNTTKTKQQSSRNGASSSGTASNYDAHGSSSSGLSDAELFLPFDDTALASQTGGWEGLEAILCSSPAMRVVPVPAASSTMCTDGSSTCCSGPDTVTEHVPRSAATKTRDPFNGAPDTILEEMAENPLDMYFPPLATYEQPETMLMSDTTSAPKHQFPEEFAGSSCAPSCAELQFGSEDMGSAGLHGHLGSAVVLDAVPVKDLSFQKLQYGMNQLDLATKGRIRDSLYRLANRLEQRHRLASASGGLGSSGSNRFESGRWAETQTNPMDQTVAQLLQQKPSYRKTVAPHRVT
ncbi:unnamed protein product [Miscanthus lutarioriparius]|uniref:Uncharacterized protein n=1 Tax=Miscanthus lutarioriparius TaxID=422564 RepID=A0A811PIV0_9POAL|nr:unnamed protein product [Miscanthus lutarioriparius]